jgi:hypothetical protein
MYYATFGTTVHKGLTWAYKFSVILTHSLDKTLSTQVLWSLATDFCDWPSSRWSSSSNILAPPRTESTRGSKGGLYHWRDVIVWRNAIRQKVEFVWSAACLSCFLSSDVKGLSIEAFSCLFNSFLRENGAAVCESALRLGVGWKPEEFWFDSRQGKRF